VKPPELEDDEPIEPTEPEVTDGIAPDPDVEVVEPTPEVPEDEA